MKNYYNKRSILASALRTVFVAENPDKLCDSLKSFLQEKRVGNNSNIFSEEVDAINDKLMKYKCITRTQRKKFIKTSNLI